ncbi:MAG: hypothetical protein IJ600_02320 [Lachnospiraceae bacterium]|nr:hypothetical protein [Lachnospiraceae bacterium]
MEQNKSGQTMWQKAYTWICRFTEQRLIVQVAFPLLLLLFGLAGAFDGADLSDTTYSLGNYAYFKTLRGDWLYATYLSNLTGYLLLNICGGRMLWMNVLTRLFPVAAALLAYHALRGRIHPVILFWGEVIALGLCWCPSVILYNYLSYFLLAASASLLSGWRETEKRGRLFAAGVFLGLSLLVRISNLAYCALVLFVWYCDAKKGEGHPAVRDTLVCIGGYLCGVAAAFLLLVLSGLENGGAAGVAAGLQGMVQWVSGLFTSSAGDAGGYSMGAMLRLILGGYLFGAGHFLPMLGGLVLGTVMFALFRDRFLAAKKVLYLCGVALLFLYYYRNGVFTVKYYNNGCIYGIGTVLLLALLLLFAGTALFPGREDGSRSDRDLAVFALLLLLIAPLGSNNHLYAVLNQMFFTAPLGLALFGKMLRRQKKKAWFWPLACMGLCFITLFTVQAVLFSGTYVFKDGEDGSRRDAVVSENVPLRGMRTSAAHKEAIEGLTAAAPSDASMITYGNLPGLHYALHLAPALSNLWPDLDSYSYGDMEEELQEAGKSGSEPVIVMAADMPDYCGDMQKKYSLLQDFIYNNGYEIKYQNEEFILYGKAD